MTFQWTQGVTGLERKAYGWGLQTTCPRLKMTLSVSAIPKTNNH